MHDTSTPGPTTSASPESGKGGLDMLLSAPCLAGPVVSTPPMTKPVLPVDVVGTLAADPEQVAEGHARRLDPRAREDARSRNGRTIPLGHLLRDTPAGRARIGLAPALLERLGAPVWAE